MSVYHKYRIRCVTENAYVEKIQLSTQPVPTTCPNDTNHTINPDDIVKVGQIGEPMVAIREEIIPTGGNFKADSVKLVIPGNETTSVTKIWPFRISALNVHFTTTEENKGDEISMCVGPDITIGTIGGAIALPTEWTVQNYTVGQTVTFTNPSYGPRVYTCILNTVSNEDPSNATYWRHGFEVVVTSTVIENTMGGYYIKLDDGTNSNDLGRVVHIDSTNSKIYTEVAPTNTYSPLTPTYVKQTVYQFLNYMLWNQQKYVIGDSKIGGQSIPANMPVTVIYKNNGDTNKTIVGGVDYLY